MHNKLVCLENRVVWKWKWIKTLITGQKKSETTYIYIYVVNIFQCCVAVARPVFFSGESYCSYIHMIQSSVLIVLFWMFTTYLDSVSHIFYLERITFISSEAKNGSLNFRVSYGHEDLCFQNPAMHKYLRPTKLLIKSLALSKAW